MPVTTFLSFKALICCLTSWLLIAVCFVSQAHGQRIFPGCQSPRTSIIKSATAATVGELRIKSYRLEESTAGVFCLSVPYEPRISLIWVGDDPLWAQHLSKDELTASFPLDWLQDGASISVSSGLSPYELTTHPERLKLPESLKQRLADALKRKQLEITSPRYTRLCWHAAAVCSLSDQRAELLHELNE